MRIEWLLAILILVVFISGCISEGGDGVTTVPTYNDNALKMDVRIKEKEENRRILPGQTIRMTVTLTNQVENATKNVSLKIVNPYGINISKVDCGNNCVCEWTQSSCCSFNGCYYDEIQSKDEIEITYGLKIPDEEQISYMGRDLKPKIVLEYIYNGVSTLYVPIYKSGEKPTESKGTTVQTHGPIHVDIDSDNWVREGDLFPIYVDVKDVVNPSDKLIINRENFEMNIWHAQVNTKTIGRCDFENQAANTYIPKGNITIPLENPLVCTLKADEITVPMVKAPIIIDYTYKYTVQREETIRVEKAFLRIF